MARPDAGLTRTFVISHDESPPSLNAGGAGSRRHWAVAHREKKKFEGIFGMLLMERRVPRKMLRCKVDVLFEFKYKNHRDVTNYEPGVIKPFADALQGGGWLPNDTAEFFEVRDVKLASGVDMPAKSRVTITIEAEYA